MTNKVKILLLVAALGAGVAVAVAFSVVHLTTGGRWLASIPAALAAAAVARAVHWRLIGRMTNKGDVGPIEHGPRGRIDVIEVFWRPV